MKENVKAQEIKKVGAQIIEEIKTERTVGKRYTVSNDSGKDSNKAKQGSRQLQFKTRVAHRSDLNQIDSKEAFSVGFEGEYYVVGDDQNVAPDLEMSKQTLEHKICIYSAIAQLVPNGSVVDLVVGIPVLLFLDKETRANYEAFLSQPEDQEWIDIEVKGKNHYFKIDKVKALPETAGHVFGNFEDYADELVGVIDIGGLNINGCIYSGLAPVHQTCFTINRGGHHLRAEIQQKLIQVLKRDIQDYQMDLILRKPKEKEAPIIREVIDGYLNRILKEMRSRNWDISEDGIQVVLTGGTSELIGKHMVLENYFPQFKLSDNPIWDNVNGFQVYAQAFLEG